MKRTHISVWFKDYEVLHEQAEKRRWSKCQLFNWMIEKCFGKRVKKDE